MASSAQLCSGRQAREGRAERSLPVVLSPPNTRKGPAENRQSLEEEHAPKALDRARTACRVTREALSERRCQETLVRELDAETALPVTITLTTV